MRHHILLGVCLFLSLFIPTIVSGIPVIVSTGSKLKCVDSESGKTTELEADAIQSAHGLAVDTFNSVLYVSDLTQQKIYSFPFTVNTGLLAAPGGINAGEEAGTDTTATGQDVSPITLGVPTEIATNIAAHWIDFDRKNGTLFTTDAVGNTISKIYQADTNVYVEYQGVTNGLPQGIESMSEPSGIAIDTRRIFFGNGKDALAKGSIMGALQVANPVPQVTSLATGPVTNVVKGVCVSHDNVFYTDGGSHIFSVKKQGSAPVKVTTALHASSGCGWDQDGSIYVVDKKSLYRLPANQKELRPMFNVEKIANVKDAYDLAVIQTSSSTRLEPRLQLVLSFWIIFTAMIIYHVGW